MKRRKSIRSCLFTLFKWQKMYLTAKCYWSMSNYEHKNFFLNCVEPDSSMCGQVRYSINNAHSERSELKIPSFQLTCDNIFLLNFLLLFCVCSHILHYTNFWFTMVIWKFNLSNLLLQFLSVKLLFISNREEEFKGNLEGENPPICINN